MISRKEVVNFPDNVLDMSDTKTKASVATNLLSEETFKALLERNANNRSNYYFLKWYDRVSGIISKLPENYLSPEGQMFNSQQEIRWKKQGENYNVLCLTTGELDKKIEWNLLEVDWDYQDRKAAIYPETETRLPNKIINHGADIRQRYFLDRQTSTVHFVALTVA